MIRPNQWRSALFTAAMPLALAACTAGPDYVRPTAPVPDHYREGDTLWSSSPMAQSNVDNHAWWQAWNDPVLDRLQAHAQQANLSIEVAAAAWHQAQAAIGEARAAGRPQLGVGVSQTRGENQTALEGLEELGDGKVRESAVAQASASWELDLWGRVRRSVEAKQAESEATAQQLRGQQLSIAATVADTYFSLRQLDARLLLIAAQIDANRQLLTMTEAGHRLGTASINDVVESRNTLDSSIIALDVTRAARAKALHALAVLVAEPPASFELAADPDYHFHAPTPPKVLPSELLRRRPDIMQAEAQVKQANANIGLAQAAYFPTLGLSAEGGYVAGNIDDLFDAPLRFWSIGAQLVGTLFDGGARRSQNAQARAAYDGTVAQYRQSVLTALQETEDALSDYRYQRRQADYAGKVVTGRGDVWQRKQHELGLGTASQRDALVETLSLLDARQTALDADSALAQDAVALFKAVGGGWPRDTDTDAGAAADAADSHLVGR